MSLEKSQIVPTAFWVGFLALGFVTSLGSADRHRAEQSSRPAKVGALHKAYVAQTNEPVAAKIDVKTAAQD